MRTTVSPTFRISRYAEAKHWQSCCVSTGMGEYGPTSSLVERLIQRARQLSIDEAADIYQAHATRFLVEGPAANQHALRDARRTAVRSGRLPEYERARRDAATAWRGALPETQGPWLMVGAAIANAAGALVLEDIVDKKIFQSLVGPWRQAVGTLMPVGPGSGVRERSRAVTLRG